MNPQSAIRNLKSAIYNGTFRKLDPQTPWFTVRNGASESDPVEILIYDQIGRDPWDETGLSATEFANALKAIPADKQIKLRIHSPGGNVWDALAMHNMIAERGNNIVAQIDGVAFSAASWVALGASKISIPKNGRMMVHDAQGFVLGAAKDMRKQADFLDQESERIANMYADKSKRTRKEWRTMMRAVTWMNGTEAKELGLVDEVTNGVALNCTFDLSAFSPANSSRLPANHDDCAGIGGASQPTTTEPKNKMNRAHLIALLNRLAIKFENTSTDEQLLALLEAYQPPQPPENKSDPKFIELENELKTIRAERDAEKKRRIETEIDNAIALGQLGAADRDTWISLATQNIAVLDQVKKLPIPEPGREPLKASGVEMSNSLADRYQKMEAGPARHAFLVTNYDAVRAARRHVLPHLRGPQNANTLDIALVGDFIIDAVITVLSARLAPLAAFSRDFGTDPMKPRATVQVAKATAGSATQVNPTNFEAGNSTLDKISVIVNQIVQSFHMDNDAINRGFALSQITEVNSNEFAKKISDTWTALLVAANFPATPVAMGVSTAFTSAGLSPIFAAAKDFVRRNLILDGSFIAYLIPRDTTHFTLGAPGAYGFDLLTMQNRWTGALTNTKGFVCDTSAIAVASGLPINQPASEFLAQNNVTVPQLGLTVQYNSWYARASRTLWASLDVMFGAAAGDGTAGVLLTGT